MKQRKTYVPGWSSRVIAISSPGLSTGTPATSVNQGGGSPSPCASRCFTSARVFPWSRRPSAYSCTSLPMFDVSKLTTPPSTSSGITNAYSAPLTSITPGSLLAPPFVAAVVPAASSSSPPPQAASASRTDKSTTVVSPRRIQTPLCKDSRVYVLAERQPANAAHVHMAVASIDERRPCRVD